MYRIVVASRSGRMAVNAATDESRAQACLDSYHEYQQMEEEFINCRYYDERLKFAERIFNKWMMEDFYQMNPREFEEEVCVTLEDWQEKEAKRYYKLTGRYPED